MWGLRRHASLLMEHGHVGAHHYPIAMLWDEAQLVVERINSMEASRAVVMRAAIASVVSKPGMKEFKQLIKELSAGGEK